MSHPFITTLKNKATNFPTLAGVVLPQPEVSVSEANTGVLASIPFRIARLRGFVAQTFVSGGAWSIGPQMRFIRTDADSNMITASGRAASDNRTHVYRVGSPGFIYILSSSDFSEDSNYEITINEGASDVFSTSEEETRLPSACRGVAPYMRAFNAGAGDSGKVYWSVILDALEEF